MTLHRDVLGKRSTDELDGLLRWALRVSVGQTRPPAYVWGRIEQEVERRRTGEARWYTVVGAWLDEIKWFMGRRIAIQAGWYAGRDGLYQPMVFSVWEGRIPLSLVCIIEQQMTILGFGWAA